MEKINYNKMLDMTLIVLLNETSNSYIEYNNLFNKNEILNNLSNRDKLSIIEKLLKDGYANKFKEIEIPNYYITVEGIIFINKGGYISKQNQEFPLKVWNYTKNVFLIGGTISAIVIAVLQSIQICRDLRISNQNSQDCTKNMIIKQTSITKKHTQRK